MNYTFIHTLDGLDALAPAWNALLAESITNAPFLRQEYLRAWWQTLGGGEWLRGELATVTAMENGELVGIAPLFLTENRDGLLALMFIGSIEISDYLDLIVRPKHLPAFVDGLFEFLIQSKRLGPSLSKPWHLLDWYNLLEASPSLPVLQAAAERRGWSFTQERLQPTPYIPLPGNFDAYLASIDKKQRHEIRRKMRRAAEYGQSIRWYLAMDGSTLDSEIDALLCLMEQDPAKANFLAGTMRRQMRATVHAAFKHGWLWLAFLEIDGEKVAAALNFDYNNRLWGYNSGVDRNFIELSPGWVLLAHMLQWANEYKRGEYDFMRGNEEYKYRFGAVDRFVMRVKITP